MPDLSLSAPLRFRVCSGLFLRPYEPCLSCIGTLLVWHGWHAGGMIGGRWLVVVVN